jgi:hypothetical protein
MTPDPASAQPNPPHGSLPLPGALLAQTRWARLGGVPALLAHPDWRTPAPTLIWLHGRTVSKELDNGRYLRLIRAGIGAVALDLPGHGERADAALQQPARTLDVLVQMIGELEGVLHALRAPPLGGLFDPHRLALGGMSAGGMVTLRRLCDPHPFIAACVEGTAGDLERLYLSDGPDAHPDARSTRHDGARVRDLSAMRHLDTWRPIPLLALHSQADQVVPLACMGTFCDALRQRYARAGADTSMIRLHTWPSTGAPQEHNGFGRVAADAKALQVEFLQRALGPTTGQASH